MAEDVVKMKKFGLRGDGEMSSRSGLEKIRTMTDCALGGLDKVQTKSAYVS